jgi:hypothetical protein
MAGWEACATSQAGSLSYGFVPPTDMIGRGKKKVVRFPAA